ncbi:Uncharacterized protein OS=Burkholderia sp. SJ98 GN=BURK_019890 PE=4 SV=1: CHAT [Gemmata massiliana]|uniref:CHAT domain-containing protein n=1 Tax=Gemmata massiliana TaxID=1210884 RepID=A0A6P2CV47_9BACT|nr:CHAT domain-containing protein [Gemmata massiliana]VTR92025.1 Uncharacterized protein OS=Burkholderia sp. SJ98 GN=BURK_019890 PE=4 SV=1: CHAT [Gemmata massiliana]
MAVDTRPVPVLTVDAQKVSSGSYRLSVQLHEDDEDGSVSWFGTTGPVADPLCYFAEFFDIVNRTNDKKQVLGKITIKGATMFAQLLPAEIQDPLVNLAAKGGPLVIATNDPWIPWEFLLIQNGHDKFLCEMCDLTRRYGNRRQPRKLHLRHLGLIVPSDSKLTTAEAEKAALRKLCAGERVVTAVPAVRAAVEDAFRNPKQLCDWWHFAGHGRLTSEKQRGVAIVLEGEDLFTDEELNLEVNCNCGLRRPLVFWNACRSGTLTETLTGVGGWAHGFINRAQATAFVGTLWNVFDEGAHLFATAFYEHLIRNRRPIGQAVREARKVVKDAGDPSWLGYTVYANPHAAVVPLPTNES